MIDLSPRLAASEARRLAIHEAAKEVFLDSGYALASMDRIAEVAGVTKRTVYAHFPSKEALFAAVVERGCRNVAAQMPTFDAFPDEPSHGLLQILRRTRATVLSPGCVRLERIVVAEAERHPSFARRLQDAFTAGETLLKKAIERWVETGRLEQHDTAAAARMLNDQAVRGPSFHALIGGVADLTDDASLDLVVSAYLLRYAADR